MALSIQVNNSTLLVPESTDPCPIWVSYYNVLQREVGKHHAKMLWLLTWKSNANSGCLTEPSFSNWLKDKELHVSNITSRSIADLSEISGNFLGLGKKMSKVVAIGVPALAVVVLLGAILVLKNSTKEISITDLASLTPVGKGLKFLK
ncbi:hypothetical protein [Aquimarina agarilytica]|uniref:hypothetical protein n=1 Tax=Aquimarina agarilytica TaxID=1087449 RepID=UPI000289D1F7|nr:hypothetical protein [Aquimarina agarilytica]